MGWARIGGGRWLAIGGGVAVGLVGEWIAFGLDRPRDWLPDLVVGWACIGLGLLASVKRPDSRTGLLLVGAGFAWFIGNVARVPFAPVAAVAAQLTLVHRAVLLHAALTPPAGRIRHRLQLAAVAVGYAAWSLPVTASSAALTLLAVVAFPIAAFVDLVGAPPPTRRLRVVSLAATTLLAGAFVAAAAVHAAVPDGSADAAVLLVNQVAIVLVALALTVATLRPSLLASRVTDLVIEASRSHSGVVRNALADALGDPSLEIGYWHEPSGTYLDATGDPVDLPAPTEMRASVRVDLDGRPAAILVHDPAALESTALIDAVRTTTTMAAANARLRGDVLDQLAEVRESRRRILLAGDDARRWLGRSVAQGPMRRAAALGRLIADAEARAEASADPAAPFIVEARGSLDRATADLGTFALGLHPAPVIDLGLEASLRRLADGSPTPVELACAVDRLPEPVALAVYYVCAEALANVAKHAQASRARVSVVREARRVRVAIVDDGVGGADPAGGSGLRGVSDRIEALGGRLRVTSEAGQGTRLVAEIPVPAAPLPDGAQPGHRGAGGAASDDARSRIASR